MRFHRFNLVFTPSDSEVYYFRIEGRPTTVIIYIGTMHAMPATRCVDYSFIFICFSLFWILFVFFFVLVYVFVGILFINARMGKNSKRIIIYSVIDTITYNYNRQDSFIMRFGGFFHTPHRDSLIETMNKKEIKYFYFNSTPCFDSTDFFEDSFAFGSLNAD